jgi:carboxypeptidase family protein
VRLSRLACALLSCSLICATTAHGQQATSELRIRLSALDGGPVSGALVALLDARDSVLAEGLTTEAGIRALRVPPGSYRVRVRRIGYLPFISSELKVPRAGELVLNVESPRVMLQGIVVNSRSQCKRTDPDARSLATVWDEIDKALRSSQLTLDDLEGIGLARIYRTEVTSAGAVVSADTTIFPIADRRPFGAIDPETLASEGYVVGDENKGWSYYAPDDVVLLSEQFAATHCFRLVRDPNRPGQIGVSFEPAPQRKLADITGVLWVDESSSELREIVFHFANAKALSRFDAGGFTRFRRMPSGTWIVDEWKLSVPRLELRQSGKLPPQLAAIGRIDNGGGILRPAAAVTK